MYGAAGRDTTGVLVSHAGRDRLWAEWVAWQLHELGRSVELDVWHWSAGENFLLKMSDALERAAMVVMLWSEAYFEEERFTTEEWTAALATKATIVPLRIEPVVAPAVLRPFGYRDLFGLDEDQARRVLLEAVGGQREPTTQPAYPGVNSSASGYSGPRLPGVLPAVWNVPLRNSAFTGRDEVLSLLRERLMAGGPVVVQALHGLGGVGKTSLAVEYAHRYSGIYDLVWWIDAEQEHLIADQLAGLAVSAGWVPAETPTALALDITFRRLRTSAAWLAVFDNADRPDGVAMWLPQGSGHVLVTSRNPRWRHAHASINVDVFTRSESLIFLRRTVPVVPELDAHRVCDATGDLPLALAQAAGVMTETGIAATEYLAELRAHADDVLSSGRPLGYPVPLAAAVHMALDRVAIEDEAAAQLLRMCALLAPEPVPVDIFADAPPGALPEPLSTIAGSAFGLRRSIGMLGRFGLVRIGMSGPHLHRLTKAIVASHFTPAQRQSLTASVESLLAATAPADVEPASWPRWSLLLPHMLTADLTKTTNSDLRYAARRTMWFLLSRGATETGRDLGQRLYQRWRVLLGPDHEDTLSAMHSLATVCWYFGEYQRAYVLDKDNLGRSRRIGGPDDIRTLAAANQVARDLHSLGRVDEARDMNIDTLTRTRRVLGEDDPFTLSNAGNLALDLVALGRAGEALALHQDTFARQRRVLGDDHPHTLKTADNLAADLRALGRTQESLALDKATLARQRELLGSDHHDTLVTADHLAADLRALGRVEEASALEMDSLSRRQRLVGDDHPLTRKTASNLAADLRALGRIEEA